MPTMSQCQILNNLVERKLATHEHTVVEKDDVDEGVRFVSVVACTKGGTPQPCDLGLCAQGTLRPESDNDITPFQMKRMELAINTAHLLQAWRHRSSLNKPFNRSTSTSNYRKPENHILQKEKTIGNLYQQGKYVSTSNANMQGFLPWRKAMSKTQLLISPVPDNFQRQTSHHQIISPVPDNVQRQSSHHQIISPVPDNVQRQSSHNQISSPVPDNFQRQMSHHQIISPVLDNFQRQISRRQLISPTPGSFQRQRTQHMLMTQAIISESSTDNPGATQSEVNGGLDVKDSNAFTINKEETAKCEAISAEDTSGENWESDKKVQRVVSNEQFMAVQCSDNIKNQLYQLGWRNPKQKKIKKKKKEDRTTNARLSYMKAPRLNLAQDPLLLKLSKKCKNIMVHTHIPEMRPRAVCFDILGAHLTHLLVWTSFKRDVLSEYDEVKVESIQFVPRSIFLPRMKNTDPVENRWVITLMNEWHRSRVTGMVIRFGEFSTQLRRYDDVASLEYRQYTRMTGMMDMVHNIQH